MKIIIAQCSAALRSGVDDYVAALVAQVTQAGHRAERLDVPLPAGGEGELAQLAALRLLGTQGAAEVLICLDAVAAVLDHPRKLVWLLDDAGLAGRRAGESTHDTAYLAHVLRAGIDEAAAVFAPSQFACRQLSAGAAARARLLHPELLDRSLEYPRKPGPELLVLAPLDERHRPELLVACLAALPHPARARWVAPTARPAALAWLRRLASAAGVDDRLAIDVRAIGAGETAYLVAHAAAVLELAQGALVAADHVQAAICKQTPVIGCSDGGALTEAGAGVRITEPDGSALARAVQAAIATPAPPSAPPTSGWAPLLEALAS